MSHPLRFEGFELAVAERQLTVGGAPAALGSRAFDVLLALAERRDRVVAKSELLELVWPGLIVEENNLQVQVSALRKLLGAQVIATVPGRGYRFTARPLSDSPSPAAGVGGRAAAARHNVPQPRTRFIGRDTALGDCARLLASSRLITLTGIGGCGKTRLAQELARGQVEAFADGVWFVDLAPVQERERVVATLAATLGVAERDGVPLLERIAEHVAGRALLLVLDNCEHVLDATVGVVERLLEASSSLHLVATSREAFGMAGEQIFPVRSLTLPASAELEAIEASEAVRVFLDRARLVEPGFAMHGGSASVVAEICRRLDGIALAIELAAARVALLSVEEIRSRLDDRFRLLTGGGRALPRHQTLQATMAWSHEQLSLAEQRLFRQLSVFVDGWSLEAAAALAGTDEYDVLALLTALHDKSLLDVDRDRQQRPRYRMLETVRQYAQERLAESGEGDGARDRHLAFFVALVERLEPLGHTPEQGRVMAVLSQEQENLLAAHAWSRHARDGASLGVRLAAASWSYWRSSAQLVRGRALALDALARADEAGAAGNPRDRTAVYRLLIGLGTTLFYMGRYEESRAQAARGIELARAAGDLKAVADALTLLSNAAAPAGDDHEADARLAEVRWIAGQLGDRLLMARTLNNIGERHRASGRNAEASACYDEALAIAREIGQPAALSVIACNYARLLIASGELSRSPAYLLESFTVSQENHLPGLDRHLLEVTAALAAARGEHAAAARLHGAALAESRQTGGQREPVDESFIAPLLERTRAALGPEAFDAGERAGQGLRGPAAMLEMSAFLDGLVGLPIIARSPSY